MGEMKRRGSRTVQEHKKMHLHELYTEVNRMCATKSNESYVLRDWVVTEEQENEG